MEKKYRRKNPELNCHAVEAFQYDRYVIMPEWFTKWFKPEKGMKYSNLGKTVRVYTEYGTADVHDGQWVVSGYPDVGFMVMDENIFNDLYEPVEEEPEHKNYTATQLRTLVERIKKGHDIIVCGVDIKPLAKEAAGEIDRLVSLVWAESKRADKAEDKNWEDQKKIARLEELLRDEIKRADTAYENGLLMGRAEVKPEPKNYSANEVFAWAYKKMQEEENNG